MSQVCFKPIGVVVKGLPKKGEGGAKNLSKYLVESVIKIYDEYLDGLDGLDEYSHLVILYYLHEVGEHKLRVRPWGREEFPEVGVFSTRFPWRPNPIGVCVVELIEINAPYLRVRGLDAWTDSPILDIKPYTYHDVVKRPRIPWWAKERWKELNERWNYRKNVPWLGPE